MVFVAGCAEEREVPIQNPKAAKFVSHSIQSFVKFEIHSNPILP